MNQITHVLQLSPNITNHDISYRIDKCIGWLKKNARIIITLRFKGREMAHPEIGFEKIKYVIEQLAEYSVVESAPKLKGKLIMASVRSKGKNHGRKQ
jgi:translation initiation factor IF-3